MSEPAVAESAAPIESSFRSTHEWLLRVAERRARNADVAEDAVHDAWLDACERVRRGSSRARTERVPVDRIALDRLELGRWTLRHASRERRRLQRFVNEGAFGLDTRAKEEPEPPPTWRMAGREWSVAEMVALLESELASLGEPERSILVAHYEAKQSAHRIAQAAGISRAAVLSRLRRCRERLRVAIEARICAGDVPVLKRTPVLLASEWSAAPER